MLGSFYFIVAAFILHPCSALWDNDGRAMRPLVETCESMGVAGYSTEVGPVRNPSGVSSMSSAESIEVTIFNQTYSLRSMSGGEHVRQIASLVDERMRLIASSITTHDISKIAILAALNIADEMQSLKAQQAEAPEQTSAASSGEIDTERNEAARQTETASAASWFDDIFDADMTPARDRGTRLSSQVSAKLQSLRKPEAQPQSIEGTEDRRRS